MCRGVSTDLTDVNEAGEGEEGLDEVLSLPPPAFVVGDGEDGEDGEDGVRKPLSYIHV